MNTTTIELYPHQIELLKQLLQSNKKQLNENSIFYTQYGRILDQLNQNTPPKDPYLARLSTCFMDCNINIETDVIKLGETDTFKLFSVHLRCRKSIAVMKLTEKNGNIVVSQDLYQPCADRETFMVMSKLMKTTQFPEVSAIDIGDGTINITPKKDRYVEYLLDFFKNSHLDPNIDIIKLGENNTTKLFLVYFESVNNVMCFKMTEKDGKIIVTQELEETCNDRETFAILSKMLKEHDETFSAPNRKFDTGLVDIQLKNLAKNNIALDSFTMAHILSKNSKQPSLKKLALDFGIDIMTNKKETVCVDPYFKRLEQLFGKQINHDFANNVVELKSINNDRVFLVFDENQASTALIQLSKGLVYAPDSIHINRCIYKECENRKTFVDMTSIIKAKQRQKNSSQHFIANCANIDPVTCKKDIYRCMLEKYLKRVFSKRILDPKTDIVDVGCNTDHQFLVYWPDQKVVKLFQLSNDRKLKKMMLLSKTGDMNSDRNTFFLAAEMLKTLNEAEKEADQKDSIIIKKATIYDPYCKFFNTINDITKKVECEDGRVLLYANDFVWQIPKGYTIKENE